MLSVASFTDRITHMKREMARHQIDFEFIFDFDANAIPAQVIDEVFAPSDLKRAHQSLVLKHRETWLRCLRAGHRRVLVFEDDVVLNRNFSAALTRAMEEADALRPGWAIYLGCGDNRHVGAGRGPTALIAGGELPATDAMVFDRETAHRRIEWVAQHRIVRPADWLIRAMDADCGVAHWWLREPLVEQGSMNGLFESVLDDKRRFRGRWYTWARFRWDKWWKRLRQDLNRRQPREH